MNSIQLMIFAFLLTSSTVAGQFLEYGQLCNITEPCRSINPLDPLKCTPNVNNTAAYCACEDGMFRHEDLNYCVSSHEGKCTLKYGDGQPAYKCTQFAQCYDTPTRSDDRTEGTCYCDRDAVYDEVSGHCKLTHESKRCKVATECFVKGLLTCQEGTCVCEIEEHQVWNNTEGKCQALINGSCAANLPFHAPECYERNTRCVESICLCMDGYTAAPDNSCYKEFQGECSNDDDCHPQFECKENNTKQCSCPAGQIYHEGSKTCQLLVGQKCEPASNLICTIHASCINNNCSCTDGFTGVLDGTCFAKYGSECSQVGCYVEDFLECSNSAKTCDCVANYLPNNNRCEGLIGQICRNTDDNDCITNSKCLGEKCQCSSGQEPRADLKQCLALHGESCDITFPCQVFDVSSRNEEKCVKGKYTHFASLN